MSSVHTVRRPLEGVRGLVARTPRTGAAATGFQPAPYVPGPTTGTVDRVLLTAGATAAGPTFVVASLFAGVCLAVGNAVTLAEGALGRH